MRLHRSANARAPSTSALHRSARSDLHRSAPLRRPRAPSAPPRRRRSLRPRAPSAAPSSSLRRPRPPSTGCLWCPGCYSRRFRSTAPSPRAGVWSPKSFISGIGNWIADEVLYQSRIHPLQIASSLTRASCEALHQSIQEVVKYAVEVDADCDRFPVGWLFHRRWGKKPGTVDGKKIEFITAGGRTTAYVPQLQKLTGIQSRKLAVANPRQLSEDSVSMESETDGEDDDLKPRKRVETFMAAIGQKTKDVVGAHSRKTSKNAGGSKEKTSMKCRDPEDDVEITEPKKIGASSSNDEHGFNEEPTARPGEISDRVRRKLVPL